MKMPPPRRMPCSLLALSIVFLLQAAYATTTTVHVGPGGSMSFAPDPVTIAPGDTVEWVWDASGHSVTSGTAPVPDGTFDTGLQSVGFTFSFTFNDEGSFPYFCTRHTTGMHSTVNVKVPSSPTPTPTPSPTSTVPPPTPTATPTPSTFPTSIISGTVVYCSNPSLNPVPGVTLTLTGSTFGSTTSDGSGNYQLTGQDNGTYTVTPAKTGLSPGASGISTTDVIATQKHFLQLATLTGCRLAAADVNADTAVNTSDVIAIQRFFLGLSTGIANVGKFQFNPASRSYSPLNSNQTGQNYDALVFGDVASSFVQRPEGGGNDLDTGEIDSTVATVALPRIAADQLGMLLQGQFKSNFIAPVTASAIDAKNKLVGFQGDFTFDQGVVTFQSEPVQNAGLTGGNWNVSGNVLTGLGPIRTLRVSAFSNDLTPLSGSGTLFELRMSRVNKVSQSTQLIWAASPDQFIFIDFDLQTQQPAYAAPGSVTTGK